MADELDLPTMELSLPRIYEPAPTFIAQSTQGEIRLRDYQGSWVVLFSHPADFTPVCTTEIVAFARAYQDFARINTALIGLSIDSLYAHIAWLRGVEEQHGVKIEFPVIADVGMEVACLYGMVQPGSSSTETVRTVFVIDPEGLVQAMIYYPATVGRMVDEIKRLVLALQATAKHGVVTPEAWQPGDPCILEPPTTLEEVQEADHGGDAEVVDWYLVKKPVSD